MQSQTENRAAHLNLLNDNIQPYEHALKEHFPSREEILQEAKAQTKRNSSLNKAALGTVLSAIFAAIWLVDPVLQSQQMQTNIGQQTAYNMPDGSVITLNTNTIVQAENRLRSRQMVLVQGEALFNVTHSWRRFTVQAHNTKIRDIGTVFNVRNTLDGAIVTVLQGAVEVTLQNKTQLLTQNQTLQTSDNQIQQPTVVDSGATTAWQQGKILFDGTSLKSAVAEIQRYRQTPIFIVDEKAAKLRISGVYDIKGVESLIDTLPISVAVNVNRKANNEVQIRSR